jgi:hypothetical protein
MGKDHKENTTESMAKDLMEATILFRESLKAFDPGIDPNTVLRFKVPVTPRQDGDTDHLTYAAVWVNGNWYTTADTGGVVKSRYTHATFMQALSQYKAFDIELATEYDRVR